MTEQTDMDIDATASVVTRVHALAADVRQKAEEGRGSLWNADVVFDFASGPDPLSIAFRKRYGQGSSYYSPHGEGESCGYVHKALVAIADRLTAYADDAAASVQSYRDAQSLTADNLRGR